MGALARHQKPTHPTKEQRWLADMRAKMSDKTWACHRTPDAHKCCNKVFGYGFRAGMKLLIMIMLMMMNMANAANMIIIECCVCARLICTQNPHTRQLYPIPEGWILHRNFDTCSLCNRYCCAVCFVWTVEYPTDGLGGPPQVHRQRVCTHPNCGPLRFGWAGTHYAVSLALDLRQNINLWERQRRRPEGRPVIIETSPAMAQTQ